MKTEQDSIMTRDSFDIAKKVLLLTAKHGVQPTPKNYAIWYEYSIGKKTALKAEIDRLIESSSDFNELINEELYLKHIASALSPDDKVEAKKAEVVDEASEGVHKLLAEILASMQSFSGEASQHEKEMDHQMQQMAGAHDGEQIKAMVQKIIHSAKQIKKSGDDLNAKLEESQKEIGQLRENLQKIKSESERDFLTSVLNRKALDKRLEQLTSLSVQKKEPVCVLMIDIDHFKKFNDTYGHQMGDQVLKIVAKALTECVKGSDIVARYGGEEFSVILPNTPIGGAVAVGESIRKNIASKELKRRDTGENYGQITVSIGAAMFRPKSDTIETFVGRADEALYKSKQTGRNRVTMEAPKDAA